MSRFIITIQGPVGSIKSPLARRMGDAIRVANPEMSVTVFDHELFAFDDHFEDARKSVYQDALASTNDVSIVVIGTGLTDNPENDVFDIRIEPGFHGARLLFHAFEEMAEDLFGQDENHPTIES